jgi:hypothetical protein
MPEYKSGPQFVKAIDGRTVTGVFAVHGNLDAGRDRSHPGAFAKTFAEGMRRVKFLWMHNPFEPPTAVIKSLREVSREELPAEVLALAPGATGGAEVVREYLDTPRGNEILTGIKAGAINEMSYGYDPVKFDFEQLSEGASGAARTIRNLREVKLWDISDVTWGLNGATVGSKFSVPLGLLVEQVRALGAELKTGRGLGEDDQGLIDQLRALVVDLDANEDSKSRAGASADATTHSEAVDVGQLYVEFQRTVARLNGVAGV